MDQGFVCTGIAPEFASGFDGAGARQALSARTSSGRSKKFALVTQSGDPWVGGLESMWTGPDMVVKEDGKLS